MTKYEIEVIKKFLNEVLCQLDAELLGETINPGYHDTDSSKEYLREETMESAKACNMHGMVLSINNGQQVDADTLEWVKHGVFARYERKKHKFPTIPQYAEVYIVGNPEHLEVTFYKDCPDKMIPGFTYYPM